MLKWILFPLIVLGLAGGGYFYVTRNAKTATENQAPATAKVESGPISLSVPTTGRVVANRDVDIKCKASGEIIKLPYEISDPVKKDTLLVEVDPVYAQRSVNQTEVSLSSSQASLEKARQNVALAEKALLTDRLRAEAGLSSAQAQLQYARTRAARMKGLAEQKFGPQEDSDLAESSAMQAEAALENAKVRFEELKTEELALGVKRQDVKLAEAQVKADQIRLDDARQQLTDTKVMAPIDGVVALRSVEKGQIIASGISNVGGGTTVMTLSDLSRLFVLASVDESDIGKVAVDQPAVVSSDAFPGRRFQGKVVRVATRGVNVSNVVTFEVKIEILGERKSLLKPEMTANVEIVAAQREQALTVPLEALRRQKGKYSVQVVKEDGSMEERTVETGISNGVRQEITTGLAEGETVVVRKGQADSRWRSDQPRNTGGNPLMPGGFGGGGPGGGGGGRPSR